MIDMARRQPAMFAASCVIVGTLALQVGATFARLDAWTWPFMDYPMYAQSHHEGERVLPGPVVYAEFADGGEVRLEPADIGVTSWIFRIWVWQLQDLAATGPAPATPAGEGEADERPWLLRVLEQIPLATAFNTREAGDIVPALLEDFETRHDGRIVGIRVEDVPVVVTRDGAEAAPPPQVRTRVDLEALGLER